MWLAVAEFAVAIAAAGVIGAVLAIASMGMTIPGWFGLLAFASGIALGVCGAHVLSGVM